MQFVLIRVDVIFWRRLVMNCLVLPNNMNKTMNFRLQSYFQRLLQTTIRCENVEKFFMQHHSPLPLSNVECGEVLYCKRVRSQFAPHCLEGGEEMKYLAVLELWYKVYYSVKYASVHERLIENKGSVPRYLAQDCWFTFHCMCVAVSCSARISISAPTSALRHCREVNLRCSALHWTAVDNNQLYR